MNVSKWFNPVTSLHHKQGRAMWRKRFSLLLSLALLIFTSAALPAVCQAKTPECAQRSCCMPDVAVGAGSAVAANCCGTFTSHDRFLMVSPDSGQAAVASVAEVTPAPIVLSSYQHVGTLRILSVIHQPLSPPIDPLLRTAKLLI